MTFSKARKIKRDETIYKSIELIRYCNRLNNTVVGGFSKLLKHFIKTTNCDDIVTYVDKDSSDGRLYHRFGFKQIDTLPPQRFYVDPTTHLRYSEKQLIRDENLEFAKENWIEVVNSGNLKFLLDLKNG